MERTLRTAVFPGSFDPFTAGHESLIKRGLEIFDKIIIAVGINMEKKGFMPMERRLELIKDVMRGESRVEVKTYSNLTADFCIENNNNENLFSFPEKNIINENIKIIDNSFVIAIINPDLTVDYHIPALNIYYISKNFWIKR